MQQTLVVHAEPAEDEDLPCARQRAILEDARRLAAGVIQKSFRLSQHRRRIFSLPETTGEDVGVPAPLPPSILFNKEQYAGARTPASKPCAPAPAVRVPPPPLAPVAVAAPPAAALDRSVRRLQNAIRTSLNRRRKTPKTVPRQGHHQPPFGDRPVSAQPPLCSARIQQLAMPRTRPYQAVPQSHLHHQASHHHQGLNHNTHRNPVYKVPPVQRKAWM